ncbi:MAG: hypothetical protein KBT03_00400 [Bacteroidales bacterium]|nr:hypothetical protein [Candidatus Scybalousia scybalohippi]
MYKVWYTIVNYNYGNYSGRCGDFDNLDDAISKFDELFKTRQRNDTYEIVVNWKENKDV